MRTAWKRFAIVWSGWRPKSATKFLPLLSRKACYRLALLLGSLGAKIDNLNSKGHSQITQGNTNLDPAPCALPYAIGVRL